MVHTHILIKQLPNDLGHQYYIILLLLCLVRFLELLQVIHLYIDLEQQNPKLIVRIDIYLLHLKMGLLHEYRHLIHVEQFVVNVNLHLLMNHLKLYLKKFDLQMLILFVVALFAHFVVLILVQVVVVLLLEIGLVEQVA